MHLYYLAVRGTSRRRRGRGAAALAGILLLASCSSSSSSTASSSTAGPAATTPVATERVTARTVPLPDGVEAELPAFTADGRHLVLTFTAPDVQGEQLGTVGIDGADFTCVTCGSPGVGVGKPFVSRDGTRVLVRTPGGKGSPTTMYTYDVVECPDSVLRCPHPTIVPVDLPGQDQGVLQTRELRISPDGRHLAFTQARPGGWTIALGTLDRGTDRYTVGDVRLLNPRFELGDASRDWSVAGAFYEVKGFVHDGTGLVYATTQGGSANFDDYLLDLSTGKRTRLTSEPDWDEPLDISPDGTTYVVGSSRGTHRTDGLGLVPRPPVFDLAAYSQAARWLLSNEARDCVVRPWLLDASRPDSQPGQELDGTAWDEGYGPRAIPTWRLDGTAIVLWEELQDPSKAPAGAPATRLRVFTLDDRKATKAHPARSTPVPSWAWTYDQYPLADRSARHTIHGAAGGTADLDFTGDFVTARYSVTYHGYSDGDGVVLDGTEVFDNPSVISKATYTVDLEVSGRRKGSVKGSYSLDGKQLTGSVTSVLGDRSSTWPPPPCPPPTTGS